MGLIISIGCDHSGAKLKGEIIAGFADATFVDRGSFSAEAVDYPDIARLVVEDIESGAAGFGVLICGTGIGMSIAANRSRMVRAALCHSINTARLAREHNDANVVCLGARIALQEDALNICRAFFDAGFCGGRHQIRVDKLCRC